MIGTIRKGEIIPLTFDIMFTEIFNNEDSICILEEFIAGYFNYSLDDVRGNLEILSRRLPKENRIDSRKEVDLLLNLNGRKINIEMSNSRSNGVINRNIVYLCKIHSEQLKYGDDSYSRINESVQIVFNNYDCHNELRKTYYLRDSDGNILSKKLRIDIINLAKGREICYTDDEYEDYLVSWCKIFTEIKENKLRDLSEQVLSNNSRNMLMKKMNKLSGDDEMIRLYTKLSRREMEFNTYKNEAREEGHAEGLAEGLAEGRAEGLAEGRVEGLAEGRIEGKNEGLIEGTKNIALNMLNEGISLSMISKCTGLTEEELEKIK